MMLKKKKVTILKDKLINVFMKNGKKFTGEKILLKSSKLLQQLSKKKEFEYSQVGNYQYNFSIQVKRTSNEKREKKVKKNNSFFHCKRFSSYTDCFKIYSS